MAKLFPDKQIYVDDASTGQNESIGIHRVTIVTTGTDHVIVGSCVDASMLHASKTTSDPTFYLYGGNDSVVAIDGGTVGQEIVVVTRHQGRINFTDSDIN